MKIKMRTIEKASLSNSIFVKTLNQKYLSFSFSNIKRKASKQPMETFFYILSRKNRIGTHNSNIHKINLNR